MDTVEFLRLLVPPGLLIAGVKGRSFSHIECRTHEELAEAVAAVAARGKDAYFALASFISPTYIDRNGKPVVRVRENVDSLQALWFDIDFKGEYPDAKAAGEALQEFCRQAKMPPPALWVHSGNGLHVYWPLSEPVPLNRWAALSSGLKEAAKAIGLKADLVCTADACRVLRPIGTFNFKDPEVKKPVRLLHSTGETFAPGDLEPILTPWSGPRKEVVGVNSELTGGLTPVKTSLFGEIVKHCPVAQWTLDTSGKGCTEPEWVAMLQLLRHCEDGADFIHKVSSGHPGYSSGATETKWAHRQANTAGPTLCKTFEIYRPEKCATCPHNGFIKSPIQVGEPGLDNVTGLPFGWRIAPDESGVERLMLTDPSGGVKEWIKQFRHLPANFRPVRSVATGQFDMMLDIRLKDTEAWTVSLPMSMLGNHRKLIEAMASFGVVLKAKEVPPFGDLMASWLEKLQNARRVADVSDSLGWISDGEKLMGFACSPTVYHSDGRIRNDVRPAREFAQFAKAFEPRGDLETWKSVAKFVTDQNHPALTAVLASSFGAPLMKFIGTQGGVVSLVSPASGVGKSSILKLAQSVWGSPILGVNSVSDTPKSVAKKIGFINSLPAFWDELRGEKSIDGFCELAFQITQGKDRSRLDSSASLRETQVWETMMIVASNESIFEAMARRTEGSDAGMVRVFEIEMQTTPVTTKTSADISLLFDTLGNNYGHAGRVYAQYLATHVEELRTATRDMFVHIGEGMVSQDRFWCGIVATMLIGAAVAKKLGLADIDIRLLREFLLANSKKLRSRTSQVATASSAAELLAAYLRDRGDRTLIIDKFYVTSRLHSPGRVPADYIPEIKEAPRSEKAAVVHALEDKLIRFSNLDYMDWLHYRKVNPYGCFERLEAEMGARQIRTVLGHGTRYAGPRVRAVEIDTTSAGFLSPVDSPDSSTSAPPSS